MGAVPEYLANWWWLIALVVAIAILREVAFGKRSRRYRRKGYSRGTRRGQRRAASRRSNVVPLHPAHRVESPTRTITGKAYVTDGDGIRVARREVRLAGLDAPEWDQKAKHRNGYWFSHGKQVKSALIQEIGGQIRPRLRGGYGQVRTPARQRNLRRQGHRGMAGAGRRRDRRL